MRILTLYGWLDKEDPWIWRHIEEYSKENFELLYSGFKVEYRMTRFNRIFRYEGGLMLQALKAYTKMENYDAIVSSHLSFGAPLAIIRALMCKKKPPLYIISFIIHDHMQQRLPFIRFALSAINRVVCHSRFEVEHYPRILKSSRDKFVFIPFGVDSEQFKPRQSEDKGYVLAIGQESRDYFTFFEAIRGIRYPVIVIASGPALEGLKIPSNVTVFSWLNVNEFIRIVEGARCVVIPLLAREYSSGQRGFLMAMSLAKAVVVTKTIGSVDYIGDGDTGFLVPQQNALALRQCLVDLMKDPGYCHKVGKMARKRVEDEFNEKRFSRQVFNLVKYGL